MGTLMTSTTGLHALCKRWQPQQQGGDWASSQCACSSAKKAAARSDSISAGVFQVEFMQRSSSAGGIIRDPFGNVCSSIECTYWAGNSATSTLNRCSHIRRQLHICLVLGRVAFAALAALPGVVGCVGHCSAGAATTPSMALSAAELMPQLRSQGQAAGAAPDDLQPELSFQAPRWLQREQRMLQDGAGSSGGGEAAAEASARPKSAGPAGSTAGNSPASAQPRNAVGSDLQAAAQTQQPAEVQPQPSSPELAAGSTTAAGSSGAARPMQQAGLLQPQAALFAAHTFADEHGACQQLKMWFQGGSDSVGKCWTL